MKSKAKSLLATCLLLALLIVPCAAQIEENALVVCSDEDGEINWVIGTPEGVLVDEFKWGNSATDDTVIYDSWATAVRQKGEWLYWDIEGSDGAFWFGLAGDTPVVFDGKPAVVRERSDGNLQWFIKGSDKGPIWWGKKGDTPVYLNGQAVVVRQEGQWLHWYVRNPADLWDRTGDFWFGLAGDTPVVSNGQPMVVREEGDKLRWYARGGSGGVLWGNAGDVPVSVPATGAPEMPSVKEVADLADVSVAFNTQFADIGLPSEVNVTLSNSSTVKVDINWTAAEDVYNSTLVDIQALEGELILDGITNPDELKAQVNVTVGEAEPAALTKIVGVTEGVPEFVPSPEQRENGWEAARITFKALDQYGREYEINVTNDMKDTNVTARVNGIPLMWGTQVKYTIGDDLVTLNDTTLYKGDDLAIAFVKEIGKETKDLGVISYTVGEPAVRVANDLILEVNSTVLAAGDTVNCTVTVVDQFKSRMDIDDEDIRWVLEKDGVTQPEWPKDGSHTKDILLKEAGDYTVTAAWDQNLRIQDTATLNVGAAKLTDLYVNSTSDNTTTANGINKEDVVFNVTWNEGAEVTKDNLKFNVTAPEGATEEDIGFEVVDEYDDEIGDLFVIATTEVAGEYKFVAYVDEPYVEADEVTVVTTINETVASIGLEEIGENELTLDSKITKNLTFLNPYGEVIQVKNDEVGVIVAPKDRADVESYVKGDNIIGLNITGKKVSDDGVITVSTGSAVLTVPLDVVAAGEITEAILGDLVSKGEVWAVNDTVAYMPVEFIDQYGNTMSLGAGGYGVEIVEVHNTTGGNVTSNFLVNWAKADAKETGYKQYSAATGSDVIAAIQLNSTVADNGTYTLKFVDEDDEVLAEKDFVLEPARELTSITLSRDSATIVINEKTPVITVCGYDQYSALYNISDTMRYDLNVTPYGVVTMDDQKESDQNLTCTLTSSKEGIYTVDINVTDTIKAPFTLTVGDVGVVDRIEIQGQDAKVTPSGGEEYTANLIDYPARINASSGNQINLTVKAYDASGKEVGYDTSELAWAISGNASDCNVVVDNGNITIDCSSVEKDSTFTVRATMMENPDVTDTLAIAISGEDPDGQTGTYYFAEEEDGTAASTINLKVDDNVSVYIYAKDQYNRVMPISANDTSLDFGSSTALGYFTWDCDGVLLNLTGKTAGTATLNLLKNAVRECSATVTVTDPDSVGSIDNLFGTQAELIGAEGMTPDMTAEPTADATPTVEPTEDVTPEPTEGTVNTSGV